MSQESKWDYDKTRKSLLKKPVRDINLSSVITLYDLYLQLKNTGGFTATKVAEAIDILSEMIMKKDVTRFLSFPACIIATGTRGVIKELIKRKMFDVVITTTGTLDHDLARIWQKYFHGSFMMDDIMLRKLEINRLGNVLVPNESYGIILEKKLQPILSNIYESGLRELSTYELIWEIGKRIDNEESIIYWATKNKIPIIVPGITDGAVGYQIWLFYQTHKDFKINILKDEDLLNDIIWESKSTGALIIGGGISKHHAIWWNQFKEGLKYAVYITTAPEWDGSLSGARTREAISWGKLSESAKHVTVEGDATILLPIIISALLSKMEMNKS
ncbi:MAG: deoxyhypusine synthase [Candidatus Asgardarchaeum sp.]